MVLFLMLCTPTSGLNKEEDERRRHGHGQDDEEKHGERGVELDVAHIEPSYAHDQDEVDELGCPQLSSISLLANQHLYQVTLDCTGALRDVGLWSGVVFDTKYDHDDHVIFTLRSSFKFP